MFAQNPALMDTDDESTPPASPTPHGPEEKRAPLNPGHEKQMTKIRGSIGRLTQELARLSPGDDKYERKTAYLAELREEYRRLDAMKRGVEYMNIDEELDMAVRRMARSMRVGNGDQ